MWTRREGFRPHIVLYFGVRGSGQLTLYFGVRGSAALAHAAPAFCVGTADRHDRRYELDLGSREGGQCGMRRSWGVKRASMMQGGEEVQARPSGTATLACGARGGRSLFAPFARLCARE
eukprot:7151607-Prymnesium_polylepis.1